MLKKILVPTDFSDCATNSVNFAVQSAKMMPVEIILMHALDVKGTVYNDYLGVNKEYTEVIMQEIRSKLNSLKRKIERKEGVVVSTLTTTGKLSDAVAKISIRDHIDLVVMGTSGGKGIGSKLWGSNTASVIGNTKVPVLAVPKNYKWKKPQNILFSTNHFEKNHDVLDIIFEMAGLFLANVQVTIFTDIKTEKVGGLLDHSRQIPQYVKFLKKIYHENSLAAQSLSGIKFEDSLQEYIDYNDIDLLVMVTYKKNLLDKILHPSKTKKMSYQTQIPLLAIPYNMAIEQQKLTALEVKN